MSLQTVSRQFKCGPLRFIFFHQKSIGILFRSLFWSLPCVVHDKTTTAVFSWLWFTTCAAVNYYENRWRIKCNRFITVVCLLSCISLRRQHQAYVVCLHLVEAFEWNVAREINIWVVTAEKVSNGRGHRSRSYLDQMHSFFDDVGRSLGLIVFYK